ncbi:MAG TPA: tRNA uridine-5-carboxymethylaminomethyl(34) synthesis GTPase MnmE [Burkholderiales bacterium]|jgi:tRNA modification GTPase|nr:tRNA uridine-5-carboxymethylaminomethyl(34) synthesis GTPase MnmE [Burkholderiales bacterium]
MSRADTIAAVATAPGRAGIGVVRISGPAVRAVIAGILGRAPEPRAATLCDFRDATNRTLDRGLALFFPAPHSYTGEDVLELHAHGGPAVLQLVLRRCLDLGARPAQPGEFTRRAFLNDKLDLAQAESVADLIDASSEAAARGAMRSLAGEFSARIGHLVSALIELRALVEATLDFPDEEIDFLERGDAFRRLARLRAELDEVQRAAQQGRILREGARCVLIGQPNVGKSSLLNRLAGDEVAIVTEIPGTTRDPLRHELVIEGVPVHVIDTAGLRESEEPVEKIGIERAWREIGQADVALLVVDVTRGMADADRAILAKLPENVKKLFIFNKIDLSGEPPSMREMEDRVEIRASAKSGTGLELLRTNILQAVGWRPAEEAQFMARERHLRALQQADAALARAAAQTKAVELFAEELRLAQQVLGEITGQFSADDLLGEIFSRFCIGK